MSTSSGSTSPKTYQGVEVLKLDQSLAFFFYKAYIDSLLVCLHKRLKAYFTHAFNVLQCRATHGQQKTDHTSFGLDAVQALHVAERFTIPLQETKVNCALLQHEWEDTVYYTK